MCLQITQHEDVIEIALCRVCTSQCENISYFAFKSEIYWFIKVQHSVIGTKSQHYRNIITAKPELNHSKTWQCKRNGEQQNRNSRKCRRNIKFESQQSLNIGKLKISLFAGIKKLFLLLYDRLRLRLMISNEKTPCSHVWRFQYLLTLLSKN